MPSDMHHDMHRDMHPNIMLLINLNKNLGIQIQIQCPDLIHELELPILGRNITSKMSLLWFSYRLKVGQGWISYTHLRATSSSYALCKAFMHPF